MDDFLADLPDLKPRRGTHVRETADLRRIRDMPRRDWENNPALDRLVDGLTQHLRTGAVIPAKLLTQNGGPVPDRLLPAQAVGLMESLQKQGALVPLVTGGGKTLFTLLAPVIHKAPRSILNLPKRMVRKTIRTAEACSPYWKVPDVLHNADGKRTVLRSTVQTELWIIQYEILPHRPSLLVDLIPDLYMGDEAHALKSRRSARTKIIKQLRKRLPELHMLFLSGSLMARDPRDFAHLARWSLGGGAPVPHDWAEMEEWALALAEKVHDDSRMDPGALLQLGDADGGTPLETARKRFAQRLTSTPGVISAANDLPPCGLVITERRVAPSSKMEHWIGELRKNNELPNGEPCEDALSMYAKERQAAMGFWYQYKTPPPIPWRNAKRAWCKASSQVLAHSRTLFSCMDVVNAIDRGKLTDEDTVQALADWRAIRDTFAPETEAIWYDESTLDLAAQWLTVEAGLCWVSHIEFGEALSKRTGVPYFREQACDDRGKYIADHTGPAIVSVFSCHEGLDLQHGWHRNLVVSMVTGQRMEQLLSRTHRRGQPEDDVYCDVLLRVDADEKAWQQATLDARCVSDGMASTQRLAIATILTEDVKWH